MGVGQYSVVSKLLTCMHLPVYLSIYLMQQTDGSKLPLSSPGRFYASLIMKMMLVQILLEWECRLTVGYFPRRIIWRSSVVPSEGTVAMFRKRLS